MSTFFRLITFYIFAASLSPALSLSSVSTAEHALVPVTPRSLKSRGIAYDTAGSPRENVKLYYGKDSYNEPSTVVTFTADRDRPIVVLDELDAVIVSVSCAYYRDDSAAEITVSFDSVRTLTRTSRLWTALEQFTLLTLHETCNRDQERGAWIVQGTRRVSSRALILTARPIPFRNTGTSFSFSPFQKNSYSGMFAKRAEFDSDNSTTLDFSKTLDQRQIVSSLFNHCPLDGSTLQATCVDCYFQNQFTVGYNIEVQVPDLTCLDCDLEFKSAAFNVTVEKFEQRVLLELALTSPLLAAGFEFTPLPSIPLFAVEIPDLFSVGLVTGVALRGNLDITGGLNFSIGATATIPSGSVATFDLVKDTHRDEPTFASKGWDGASIDLIPFRLNGGDLNATVSAALSPFVGLEILALPSTSFETGVTARIYVDTPRITFGASLQERPVNRACQPIGENDFESFSSALLLSDGLSTQVDAEFALRGGGALTEKLATLFPLSYSLTLFQYDVNLSSFTANSTCTIIAGDSGAASNSNSTVNAALEKDLQGQIPAPTGTLLPAASAVPTFDIPKIEAYLQSNGKLPENVNYQQMVLATTVPESVQSALNANPSTTQTSSPSSALKGFYIGTHQAVAVLVSTGVVLLSRFLTVV